MRPKRLISLLVAVCMMITMLPLSAVTAFAADTSTVHEANDGDGIYKYAYTVNAENGTATITKFLGPVDPANNGPYDIEIPTELDHHPVTGLGEYSFSGTYSPDHQTNHNLISFCNQIQSVTIPESVTSIGKSAFEHWLQVGLSYHQRCCHLDRSLCLCKLYFSYITFVSWQLSNDRRFRLCKLWHDISYH